MTVLPSGTANRGARRPSLARGRRIAQLLAAFVAATASGVAIDARADVTGAEPRESCDAAFEDSELLLRPRDARLLDARAALRLCARPSCKPWMIDDCTKRLAEVEGRIPSVVFSARDARGAPLYDVRVLDGDREVVGRLDGRAVEMEPGPHELVAERGAVRVTASVVVMEGKKAQQVDFAFADGSAQPADVAPSARAPWNETAPGGPLPMHSWARPLAGGLLLGGLVAGGLGAGLVAVAIDEKSDAHCDANDVCDGGPLESARQAARAATVSFVVGGVLLAGAAVTFFTFGRATVRASSGLGRVQVAVTW